jgi:O-succinylhomoserine sulfhydrylase
MEFGADIVIHSSTKYIDGQGRAMGGIILCKEDFLKDHLQIFLRNTGPCMSPFNAWVHLKSLETLDIRMREHSRNAVVVADFLAKERNVRRVLYPFREDGLNAASNHPQVALAKKQMSAGGGVVTFEVTGGKKEAFKVAKALKLVDISNNLGDTKSLLTHPGTTTHQRMTPEARLAAGVTDGMLRISVGLEDSADICDDLAQALAQI